MYERYLRDIGLSEKESIIYISLLSFDRATVAEISKKSNIKRPTTYVILENLAKKGLVSESNVGKKSYYIAEPPEKLHLFVERQIHLLEDNKKSLDIVVPQLRGLKREQGEKPVVQYYDGKEGVISSNFDTFSEKIGDEPVYIVYSRDLVKDVFTEKEAGEMRERRISMGIKSKAIYTSITGEKPSDNTGDRMRIDEKKYPITSDITIYDDQVKIAVFSERISGISIKSKEFSNTLKSIIKYIFDHK